MALRCFVWVEMFITFEDYNNKVNILLLCYLVSKIPPAPLYKRGEKKVV